MSPSRFQRWKTRWPKVLNILRPLDEFGKCEECGQYAGEELRKHHYIQNGIQRIKLVCPECDYKIHPFKPFLEKATELLEKLKKDKNPEIGREFQETLWQLNQMRKIIIFLKGSKNHFALHRQARNHSEPLTLPLFDLINKKERLVDIRKIERIKPDHYWK